MPHLSASVLKVMPAINASELASAERLFYAPLLVAGFTTFALWGIIWIQVYNYYMSELTRKDSFSMKFIIGFLWFLETIVTAINAHMVYYYLVSNFGDVDALFTHVWSMDWVFIFRAIEILLIRWMFLRRLFVMSRGSILVTGWIIFWSLVEFAAEVVMAVELFSSKDSGHYPQQLFNAVYVAQSSLLMADISLAALLSYYLYQSRTGFRSTDSVLKVLIVYTVNTTVLVVAASVIATSLFITKTETFTYWPSAMAQTRLYFISFMATVNAREGLRRTAGLKAQEIDLSSTLTVPSARHLPRPSSPIKVNPEIHVTTTIESFT